MSAPPATAIPKFASEQPMVLIVDDTPQNLNILGELLQPLYRVRAANTGARALRAAHTEPRPDIILLDVMMPEMDGIEVLQQLKADPETADIPIIFITAMSGVEDEQHGLELGAVDYITKPFAPAIVRARVATQLELKQARDRLARQNDWLESEVRRRMSENLLIQDLAVRALACIGEARDSETGNHIVRTRSYVELLANHLVDNPRFRAALAGDRLEMVVNAAPLHDIGKVGIPDAILLKPGKLSPEEYDIMKQHPVIGADAIERAMSQALASADRATAEQAIGAFAFLQVAQEICLSHHERWDGSGYPDGLVAEQIPVSARLMALADVFDALVCKRVYKPAMSMEVATATIIAGRGCHFDPDVVDAFLSLRDRFIGIASLFADTPAVTETQAS
jgi:putative two-component system response regulator